ncbi:MAG: GTP cyclohydrolase MptA [Deltaproteobacteria bacterium]|nr:GTP cyclohydrolase MptA [Deltaproteobacteria bacterium]
MTSLHTVYLSLGSNLGDRQANIIRALQHLRPRAEIRSVSSYYETDPVGILDQPTFYNIACRIKTDLAPKDLLELLKRIEKRMGRQETVRNGPRPIDIDILLYDALTLTTDLLSIPHPRMHERAFVLVPLAEIAPNAAHPALGLSVESLLTRLDRRGVTKLDLKPRLEHDRQQDRPAVSVSLSRVGVTNLRRNIRLTGGGAPQLFLAELDLFADLPLDHAGVHLSRFSDAVEALVQEMTLEPTPDIESLASRLSRQVVTRHGALRSEVRIKARSPIVKTTPVSGKVSEELYTLIGIASTSAGRTRCLVGVETEGMTVCPCAQDMVRDYSRELLLAEGFTPDEAERILQALPIASHNQRGRGTLIVGSDVQVRAENLVYIVETAMSSETYALLKLPDELFVVNKAHRNPRFVEDVTREILRGLVDSFPELPDDAFVLAKQENLESIHKHNVVAERFGTMGEIRRELSGESPTGQPHTSLARWLDDY